MKVEEAKRIADGALEKLAAALERGESRTLKSYLVAMGRFHRYSLRNVMLIVRRRPDTTRVAGFHTWKKLGRRVRKGEKGIPILAPLVRRSTRRAHEEEDEETGRQERDDGDVLGFKVAHVFAVEQTDGKPLPEFARVSGDPGSCTERLKAFTAKRGIKLEYSKRIAPVQGASSGGRITLLPGLSHAEELSVLAHEVAHEMLHTAEDRREKSKAVRETEAEAVAYVVCAAIGLEVSSSASDYIRIWDGDTKTLAASLERIRRAAVEIIQAVTPLPERQAGIQGSEEPATGRATDRVKVVSPHRFGAAA